MWHDVRAEWLTQSRRPAHVALLGLGVTMTVLFGYLVPALGSDNGGVPIQQVQQVPFSGVAIAGLPMVVGGLMVVAGALVVGSEYEWHTWRTILTQRSGRVSVVLAKLVVVAGLAAAATITLLSASAVTTTVIGWASGVAPRWPSAAEVLIAAAVGVLSATTWGCFGMVLAATLRGVAMPIGLGLAWILGVQTLLAGLAAPSIDLVADLQQWMPGPAVGALVAAAGASDAAPGVAAAMAAGRATVVAAAWMIGFAVVTTRRVVRWDVTG